MPCARPTDARAHAIGLRVAMMSPHRRHLRATARQSAMAVGQFDGHCASTAAPRAKACSRRSGLAKACCPRHDLRDIPCQGAADAAPRSAFTAEFRSGSVASRANRPAEDVIGKQT